MTLLTTLIQWGIVYYLCGFNGDFLSIAMASFALSAASCSVALVLGSLVDDVKTASELQPLVFTPQLLFAGYFIRTSHIPSFLRWSEYLCSLKYAISLILLSEFDPNNINCQGEAAAACSSILTRNGIELESWRMYCFVLFAIFLGFRTIAAIVLVRRAKFFY
jgi:ABC-type multidrug transport system permease subunit